MFGGFPFAGAPFAGIGVQAAEEAIVFAPAGRPAKKKKKPELDDGSWPGMIWPQETPRPKVPVIEPSTGVASPPPIAPAVKRPMGTPSKELVHAVAGKLPQLDHRTMRQIAEMKLRLRREIEDEEALLLLGAFDE